MGLDQYAYARSKERKGCELDLENDTQLMYWRKHANLEGWMSDLYRSRGGNREFNCVELKLGLEDIERLEKEYLNFETSKGFFWGQSSKFDNDATGDFIALAYKAIEDGYDIIYTSWW